MKRIRVIEEWTLKIPNRATSLRKGETKEEHAPSTLSIQKVSSIRVVFTTTNQFLSLLSSRDVLACDLGNGGPVFSSSIYLCVDYMCVYVYMLYVVSLTYLRQGPSA